MTARDEWRAYVRDVKARLTAAVEALDTALNAIPEIIDRANGADA